MAIRIPGIRRMPLPVGQSCYKLLDKLKFDYRYKICYHIKIKVVMG